MPNLRSRSSRVKTRSAQRRLSPAHGSFIYKIGMVRRLLDRYSGPAFTEQSGLTLAEWRVLTTLYSYSPLSPRQLGQHLRTDKAEVSRACARLIRRGSARRQGDPIDRRSVLVTITPQGEHLHDTVMPLRDALQRELEAALTRSEAVALHRALDKLMAHVSGWIEMPAAAPSRSAKQGRAKRKSRR